MITIDILRKAGCSAELIVRIIELEQNEHRLARREQNRINQRNHRVRKYVSADVAVSNDTTSAYIESKKVSKKEKKIYIPADFALNEADLAACREAGWTDAKIATELVRFEDHAAQNGRQCVDWHAAWRSWVRSPFQTQTKPGGMNGHHVAAKPNVSDVLRGMAEETRRREGADFGGLLPEV